MNKVITPQTPFLPQIPHKKIKRITSKESSLAIPRNRAKIIATLGPASSSEAVIREMIEAGVSVFRLNMSHGEHETHRTNIQWIRKISLELASAVGILADLQGPKLRTGQLLNDEPMFLKEGETVVFRASEERGGDGVITTQADDLLRALKVDDPVLINDGMLQLRVVERLSETEVRLDVIQGGKLTERKGINVPTVSMDFPALTEKDKVDALFALGEQVDFLALSFVRSAEDTLTLKRFIIEHGFAVPPIIAKIEKPQALDDIDAIIEDAAGLMVARGDLGVELSAERVPAVQKQLIKRANELGKPIIVATQMLESMIESVIPSRAEASDVANAVFDGADAVMLSGETAMGAHPVKVIQTMRKIIIEAECYYKTIEIQPHESSRVKSTSFHHVIAQAASYASMKTDVTAVVVLSSSGKMACRVSKLKPHRPIIALTEEISVCNRMTLFWGIRPLLIQLGDTTEEVLNNAERQILSAKLLTTGDTILFCAGDTPIAGSSNMLKFLTLGESIRSSAGLIQF